MCFGESSSNGIMMGNWVVSKNSQNRYEKLKESTLVAVVEEELDFDILVNLEQPENSSSMLAISAL